MLGSSGRTGCDGYIVGQDHDEQNINRNRMFSSHKSVYQSSECKWKDTVKIGLQSSLFIGKSCPFVIIIIPIFVISVLRYPSFSTCVNIGEIIEKERSY